MAVIVALLCAVNVGGRKAPSSDLKRICADLGWQRVETLLASGNIIADIGRAAPAAAAGKLEASIRTAFGFEAPVILRTASDLDGVLARQPFDQGFDPKRLLVHFLREAPAPAARKALASFAAEKDAEPFVIDGAEVFLRYDNCVSESRLTAQVLRRVLCTPGTARNWNTIEKLRARAHALESS